MSRDYLPDHQRISNAEGGVAEALTTANDGKFIAARTDALVCSARMVSFARYWLPLLLWMSVIFSASADAQSTQRTSRFLGPFLHWVWPGISEPQIEAVRWCVRKAAHVIEYAILAWLWWRALRRPGRNDLRPWSWPVAGWALLAVALYAATDEWHQTFVPNRSGTVRDVLIDTAGGALGLGILWLWRRRKHRHAPGR